MSLTLQEDFALLSPTTPLPWNVHPSKHWLILDANGDEVCNVNGSSDDARAIVGMILCAVNTCGGFKAELAS